MTKRWEKMTPDERVAMLLEKQRKALRSASPVVVTEDSHEWRHVILESLENENV